MQLTEADERFLRKREKLTRLWPIFGGFLLASLTFLIGWMLWRSPLLLNPVAALNAIGNETLAPNTLRLMAGMLPFAMIIIFVLLSAMILFVYAALSNEKRHLGIIRRMQ